MTKRSRGWSSIQGRSCSGTDTASPYAFNWTGVAAGTYSLRAIAYDGDGANATSATTTITVTAASSPPTGVVFQKSLDHATLVTSYELRVFANGANPNTATPVAKVNLGKPDARHQRRHHRQPAGVLQQSCGGDLRVGSCRDRVRRHIRQCRSDLHAVT